MGSCSGVDTVCQLLAWIAEVVDIKVVLVLTITAYVSWSMGYEKGQASACKKGYCDGFINGIMFLMVKFKAETKVSFDLVFERDIYVTEAIHRIGKGVGYKLPSGDRVC